MRITTPDSTNNSSDMLNNNDMINSPLSVEDLNIALSCCSNTSPGPVGIP